MAEGNSLEVRGFQSHLFICAEGTSHGAAREREKLAKRVSHRLLENFSDRGVS